MSEQMKTVTVNPELTAAVAAALDPADIRAAVIREAEKQNGAADEAAVVKKAADDKTAADAAIAAAAAAASSAAFSRTESIGGKEFLFEASSELELERIVNNAFKVAYAVQQTDDTSVVAVDPAIAQAAAEKAATDRATALVELELKFKRGEISAADYIEQSGAVSEYLEKQGISVESLRESVDQTRSRSFEQSWAEATEIFKNSPAGQDWPGGQKNLEIIGMKLSSMNLVDAEDKVAALAQAYAAMKASGTLFPYETPAAPAAPAVVSVAAAPAISAVAAAAGAAPAAPAAPKIAPTSSSLFGVSSGVGAGEGVSKVAPAGDMKIDPNASPAEILAAWKTEQLRLGKDPNQAFTETFSARRT